jgi:flagellar biogenesis protein FliO
MFSFSNTRAIIATLYYQNDDSIALSLFKIILYFIVFLLVIVLAFYFTKLVAKKTSYMTKSNNIQILDFIALSSNSKIAIVNIIDNIYILSINNNEVTVIDKLSKEDANITNLKVNSEQKSFNNYLEDIFAATKKLKNKVPKSKTIQFSENPKSEHDISLKDSQIDKE